MSILPGTFLLVEFKLSFLFFQQNHQKISNLPPKSIQKDTAKNTQKISMDNHIHKHYIYFLRKYYMKIN